MYVRLNRSSSGYRSVILQAIDYLDVDLPFLVRRQKISLDRRCARTSTGGAQAEALPSITKGVLTGHPCHIDASRLSVTDVDKPQLQVCTSLLALRLLFNGAD